ncbi:hypothetical protein HHK36_021904 [Tetracentron sinense]|uniref:Uncharacterized protein n=1 Tax=Tetracentron sinense TaxID=13715 RepID=A0A835D7U0_TETSI|nr:hypothetical protein HHK36_021904 [Tetracentron sinense]
MTILQFAKALLLTLVLVCYFFVCDADNVSACVVVVSLEAGKPLAIQQVDHGSEDQGMTNNPNFVEEVSPHFGKDNEIIVGCQTGKRLLMVTTDLLSAVFNVSLVDLSVFTGLIEIKSAGCRTPGEAWATLLEKQQS